ncbi:hypothetical protein AGABI2DRAFT_191431 [Agaricus bisporus var. bisporus H97]|uniref:hypothetical protein n=1 Tax=Agaricus bisporus var. bisporus (strain H97 / ATCC MYA-4626 / FGSC 10389) TaxID=936046 RepID=UPI00029F5F9F|nr:hypothetical protein AGABI2DRAFT_191431 [Agaricus bisporus var. bisporus H97]EKV49390.1 hypothetical protein AGABI2DRAFT_191431 [Agaricus bisporus var. bisporus H97]
MAGDLEVNTSRLVKSADGTEIYTDATGNRSPSTPVLVLVHGLFMNKGAFNPIFDDPKWTSSLFLVRYDTRGHGRSGKSVAEEAWESKRFSEDFEAVCREFEVREAYVLGWSMGAALFPDIMTYTTSVKILGFINVAGVVSVDPSIKRSSSRPLANEWGGILLSPPSVDAFQEALFQFLHICSDELSPELFRILLEGMIMQPRGAAVLAFKRKQNPEKMLQEARGGRLPLLGISGLKDKGLIAEELKRELENLGWKRMTYRFLQDADHIPWVSCAEEFREIVLTWIKELTP